MPKFLIYLSFFLFIPLLATARPTTVEALIEGTGVKVVLSYNEKMDLLLEALEKYEKFAASKGHKIEFLTGAGEFRRMLLNQIIDGPGDVEVFAHFYDIEIPGKVARSTFKTLKDIGIDLEKKVAEIFGKDKVLDLFAKDKHDIKNGNNYFGPFGYFEDMGETSINNLTYRPSTKTIYGPKESRDALANKKALYIKDLESLTANYKNKNNILGIVPKYKVSLFNVAIRTMRFYIDLLISPNPNKITLDKSFEEATNLLNLYFEGVDFNRIKNVELNQVYQKNFLKIFKNRTPEELVKIREIFKSDRLIDSYNYLTEMGVDIDYLTQADWSKNSELIQFRGVVNNAVHKHVIDLYDFNRLTLENPFLKPSLLSENIKANIRFRGVPQEDIIPIPDDMLQFFSPELYYKSRLFSELDNFEKSSLMEKYHELTKSLSGPLKTRLKNKDFFKYYKYSSSILESQVSKKEMKMSLLQYLVKNKRKLKLQTALIDESLQLFDNNMQSFIDQQVKYFVKKGISPFIYIALDNTLFDLTNRKIKILQDFDKTNNTSIFKDISYEQLFMSETSDLVYQQVMREKPSIANLDIAEKAIEFYNENISSSKYFDFDSLNSSLAQKIKNWRKAGATIKFLTKRREYYFEPTYQVLKKHSLITNEKDLIMRELEDLRDSEQFKKEFIEERSKKADPIISFIENDRDTIVKIQSLNKTLKDPIFAVQAYVWTDPKTRKVLSTYVRNNLDLYYLFHGPQTYCQDIVSPLPKGFEP